MQISDYLRHKPPILLLDEIVSLHAGVECTAIVELTKDKWFFSCHYPGHPVMPGSLLIEAMSQVATVLIVSTHGLGEDGEFPLLSEVTKTAFKKEASPGSRLVIGAKLASYNRGVSKIYCICESNQELLCYSTMNIVIPKIMKEFVQSKKGD
jgi:3-hydroxyacyl-[acyl-carrier-protein] dehydratase